MMVRRFSLARLCCSNFDPATWLFFTFGFWAGLAIFASFICFSYRRMKWLVKKVLIIKNLKKLDLVLLLLYFENLLNLFLSYYFSFRVKSISLYISIIGSGMSSMVIFLSK